MSVHIIYTCFIAVNALWLLIKKIEKYRLIRVQRALECNSVHFCDDAF